MDEAQGPVAECATAPTQQISPVVCVTINKVENGFLVNSRDRHYSSNKDFIYLSVDQVIEHIRTTFA